MGFDVNTQQLTNLTPDLVNRVAPGQFEGNWDVWSHWSNDSQRLLFVRHAGADQDKQLRPQLFTISAGGGEPQLVKSIQNSTPLAMDVMPTWSTADDSIGYNIRSIGGSDQPAAGVWVTKAGGQDAHHVLGVPAGNSGGTMLEINFSADERYLLMPYDYLRVAGKSHPQRSIRVAAVDGSGDFPVAGDDSAQLPQSRFGNAVLDRL